MQNNHKWMQNYYATHKTDIKRYIQNNYNKTQIKCREMQSHYKRMQNDYTTHKTDIRDAK